LKIDPLENQSMANRNWLSLHLYYEPPYPPFFLGAILPFLEELKEEELIISFFFIRYRERGPHIRLRLRCPSKVQLEKVRAKGEQLFETYFQQFPSICTTTKNTSNWLPNNSIQIIPYEPEQVRFGGEKGLEFVEQQFHLSSAYYLRWLKEQGEAVAYDSVLSFTLQLQVGLIHAAGLSWEEAYAFFQFYDYNWLPHLIEPNSQAPDEKTDWLHRIESNRIQFKDAFEAQAATLKDFVDYLWTQLESKKLESESPLLWNWYQQHQKIWTSIKTTILSLRPKDYHFNSSLKQHLSPQAQNRWMLLADCLHLNKNRLGIPHQEESYLAYLLTQSMKLVNPELPLKYWDWKEEDLVQL